jgi:hypothetical protein
MQKVFRFLKLRKNSSDIQDEYINVGLSERIRGNGFLSPFHFPLEEKAEG